MPVKDDNEVEGKKSSDYVHVIFSQTLRDQSRKNVRYLPPLGGLKSNIYLGAPPKTACRTSAVQDL